MHQGYTFYGCFLPMTECSWDTNAGSSWEVQDSSDEWLWLKGTLSSLLKRTGAMQQSKTFFPSFSFSFTGVRLTLWSDNFLNLLWLPPTFSHRHFPQSVSVALPIMSCYVLIRGLRLIQSHHYLRGWAKICAVDYLFPKLVYSTTNESKVVIHIPKLFIQLYSTSLYPN